MKRAPTKNRPEPTSKRRAFGVRVRTERERLGLTTAKLGEKIGLSENSITQYETGRAVPRPERLEALAMALGVGSHWLLTGSEPEDLVKAQTKFELEILAAMRDIPVDSQAAAAAAFRSIANALKKS